MSRTRHNTLLDPNPMMNRAINREYEVTNEQYATYFGITVKTAFFLLMTVVGMVCYYMAQITRFRYQTQIDGLNYEGFQFTISVEQLLTLGAATIILIISQLLASFIPSTIPVTGTIYSVSQGVLLSGIIFTFLGGEHMEYLGLLALIITVIVVASMALLYTKGIIKVDHKFMAVLMTIMISMIVLGAVMLICSFIPGLNVLVGAILNNFWVSLAISLLSLVVAALFLVSEFAVMDEVVTYNMSVKYEWPVAFGLAYAILWIYIKVLQIIVKIFGRNKD